MLSGLTVSSKLACEIAATVKRSRPLVNKWADRIGRADAHETTQTFFPVAAHQPESLQRQCKLQLCRSQFRLLGVPCERSPEVFLLSIQTPVPFSLGRPRELAFGALAEVQKETQEPRLYFDDFAGLAKTVESILTDCFQHAITHATVRLIQDQ